MRPDVAEHPGVCHTLSVCAMIIAASVLFGAGNLYADRIKVETSVSTSLPPGGCNIGQGGQTLVHHDKCICTTVGRSYTNLDTGNTWGDISFTCAPAIAKLVTAGSTLSAGYDQMTISFKQQPTGPISPPRYLRCENGFADLTDSSGKVFEPAGPCGGGDWTMQLPEKSFEVGMKGLHYPSISDCALAKANYFSNFKQNVPLKNLCKTKDQTAVPASILRIECAPGTKANGFIGGSVVSVVVTCQGS
jgi:hypothetical protein